MVRNNNTCKICGNDNDNKTYVIQEMMFGTKDKFYYIKCSKCGCLQLKHDDIDLSKYYPNNYYSLSMGNNNKDDKIYNIINKIVLNIIINNRIINKFFPQEFFKTFDCLRGTKIVNSSKILDVGCGSGLWLNELSKLGFTNLRGVDLYIRNNINHKNGISISKGEIDNIKNEKFDVITFHHSFEHMRNPQEVFNKIYELLNDKGICIIRIPVIDSYAWKKYKTNWVQIDAPRHLYLHSKKSIEMLAENSNLKVYDIRYDSTEFQFWGSEEYMKGIPLITGKNRVYGLFSNTKMKKFKRKARILNKKHIGDQAIFYISK